MSSPPRRSAGRRTSSNDWYDHFDAQYDSLLQEAHQVQQPQTRPHSSALPTRVAVTVPPPNLSSAPASARPQSSQSAQRPRKASGDRRRTASSDYHSGSTVTAPLGTAAKKSRPSLPASAHRAPSKPTTPSAHSQRPSSSNHTPSTLSSPASHRAPPAAALSPTALRSSADVPAGLRHLLQDEASHRQRATDFKAQRAQERTARLEEERRKKAAHKAKMKAIRQRPSASVPPTPTTSAPPVAADSAVTPGAVPPSIIEQRVADETEQKDPPQPARRVSVAVGVAHRDSQGGSRRRGADSAPSSSLPRTRRQRSQPDALSASRVAAVPAEIPSVSRRSPTSPARMAVRSPLPSSAARTPPTASPTHAHSAKRAELRRLMESMRRRKKDAASEETAVEVLVPKPAAAAKRRTGSARSSLSAWNPIGALRDGRAGSGLGSISQEFAVVFASANASRAQSPRISAPASDTDAER